MLHKLHHRWKRAKSFVAHGYRQLGGWAKQMDSLAGVGRKALALAAPILDDFGQGEFVKQGVQVLGGYDAIKQGLVEADQYARGHGRRIADADLFG